MISTFTQKALQNMKEPQCHQQCLLFVDIFLHCYQWNMCSSCWDNSDCIFDLFEQLLVGKTPHLGHMILCLHCFVSLTICEEQLLTRRERKRKKKGFFYRVPKKDVWGDLSQISVWGGEGAAGCSLQYLWSDPVYFSTVYISFMQKYEFTNTPAMKMWLQPLYAYFLTGLNKIIRYKTSD